jgi:hypothetical protein
MKSLTVLELSKLYKINRQTIYNNINKGILSKNSENKIDLAEAIRVFGEPSKKQDVKESVKIDSPNSAEFLLLRQQIDMLKNQLDDAKEREVFYQNQIETMQRLLEAPKQHNQQDSAEHSLKSTYESIESNQVKNSKYDGLTTNNELEDLTQSAEERPIKRGFLSRFFN